MISNRVNASNLQGLRFVRGGKQLGLNPRSANRDREARIRRRVLQFSNTVLLREALEKTLPTMKTWKPAVNQQETHWERLADADFKPMDRGRSGWVSWRLGLGRFPFFLVGLVAPSVAGSASDEVLRPKPHPWAVTARWENDSFAGSDRYYTDGVSLSVTRGGDSALDPLIDRLPWSDADRTLGVEIAQTVFTPKDTRRAVADPSDRPYAGILAVGLSVHLERDEAYRGFKLVTGVLGPSSLADETIRFVHQIGSWSEPRGWDSQLADEPILNLMHEYRHRYPLFGSGEGWEIQALPVAGLAVGNLLDEGYGGALVRAGYRVPRDFGPTLLRGMGQLPPPTSDRDGRTGWGFALHAGTQAHLVLRDMTLDGNSFRDGPRVDKNVFVPMGWVGMAVGNERFQTCFSYVFRGKEFQGQDGVFEFGSVTMIWRF